jgi:hypothetical protein
MHGGMPTRKLNLSIHSLIVRSIGVCDALNVKFSACEPAVGGPQRPSTDACNGCRDGIASLRVQTTIFDGQTRLSR